MCGNNNHKYLLQSVTSDLIDREFLIKSEQSNQVDQARYLL